MKYDLFLFENKQSYYLYEIFNGLNKEDNLFEIYATMDTLNVLISQLEQNPYLLLQLFALLYETSEDFHHEFFSEDILSLGDVEKYVYYISENKFSLPTNDKLEVLKNISLPISKRKLNKKMNILDELDDFINQTCIVKRNKKSQGK